MKRRGPGVNVASLWWLDDTTDESKAVRVSSLSPTTRLRPGRSITLGGPDRA